MDILKTATGWAKADMLSSGVFIVSGIAFVLAGLGFWHLGKTDMARAFVIPMLVAGALLAILGGGLLYGTWKSLAGFEAAFTADAPALAASEIERADRIMAQYRIAVLRVMPSIIITCAALLMMLHGPVWRASLVTTIATITIAMLIDTNANARLEAYKETLLATKSAERVSREAREADR